MSTGGWIGAGASGLKVKETCRARTEEACRKVKFTEAGKFSGNLGGGAVAGLLASPVCVAIGIPTYGLGSVACVLLVSGLGAATFETAGSDFGEFGGELVYEVTK
jgi:hypothetical protein